MKHSKSILGALGIVCLLVPFISVASAKIIEEKNWAEESVVHEGFTDLGNYVIRLKTYDDPASLEEGIAAMNKRYDHGDMSKIGCTALVTLNSAGEVIFGRNMDLEISQSPAYISETTYGKYRTIGVSYMPRSTAYEDLKSQPDVGQDGKSMLPLGATDCLNEKGLFVQVDMRTSYSHMSNYGLHSKRGETERSDGKKWSELRVCMNAMPLLICQNCATVKEAVDFVKNSYDWYTMGGGAYDGWNLAFLVGDATGDYGLVEIAQDEVHFVPHQYGQSNYYISPVWNALDVGGTGYGRLRKVAEIISGLETKEEAMDAMVKNVSWRHDLLWLGDAYRADDAAHPNPYNQIVFQDSEGNPQLDWRGDYVQEWMVMDDGRMLVPDFIYENAVASTYDPLIKKFYDDAVARGTLVVDDGTFKFAVGEENVTLKELIAKKQAYDDSEDPAEKQQLAPYNDAFMKLFSNMTANWCLDDRNFEAVRAYAYEKIHARKNSDGDYDPECMSLYEKIKAFYGIGVEKDDKPLRDDASIWTTSLNIGVNCAKKEMKIRFWENDEAVYSIRFDESVVPGEKVSVATPTTIPAPATYSAKNLPKGLSISSSTGVISGVPKVPGSYVVQVTVTSKADKTKKETVEVPIVVGPMPKVDVQATGTGKGKVKGAGEYLVGKKVTLKATAEKGSVFLGWYDGDDPVSNLASYSVVVPAEGVTLFARFITADEDKAAIKAAVAGADLRPWASKTETNAYATNVWAGVYLEWPVAAEALSATTVKVTGLPAGLKYAAKPVTSKIGSGKTAVLVTNVPANTIYGAPTRASTVKKNAQAATPTAVKVAVTTAGKSTQNYQIDLTVDPLPAWAQGTFDGGSDVGQANLTISAAGKATGKWLSQGETWTLSAANYERYEAENGVFVAKLLGKKGKASITNELLVAESGAAYGELFALWPNPWKLADWKAVGKTFDKKTFEYAVAGEGVQAGTVALKFAASGKVTVTGSFQTGADAKSKPTKATGSAVLVPQEKDAYLVFIYLPAKGAFRGHAKCVQLKWNGEAFEEFLAAEEQQP